jgi:predicted flavoprotein YhiN
MFLMGLVNGQPMAKGNLRYVEGPSIYKHGQYPNLKKKNLLILKIKDRNPSIKSTREMSRHNPKKKKNNSKQSMQNKVKKIVCK